jgi:hypothetical protein
MITAWLADIGRKKGLQTVTVRKALQVTGFVAPSILLLLLISFASTSKFVSLVRCFFFFFFFFFSRSFPISRDSLVIMSVPIGAYRGIWFHGRSFHCQSDRHRTEYALGIECPVLPLISVGYADILFGISNTVRSCRRSIRCYPLTSG